MYGDTKTSKDRLSKKTKATGIFGKRAGAKTNALERMKEVRERISKAKSYLK